MKPGSQTRIDSGALAAIRERLAEARGPEYWRSLEEIAGSPEFNDFLENEFPQQAEDWRTAPNRRDLLKLMGASLALAGASACTRQPPEKIVPYVRAPEEVVPGKPLFFATAMPLAGVATGVLVESHMGRPTKIEGNPQHPASLGATSIFAQASVLSLYDPDRAQVVTFQGRISSWVAFQAAMNVEIAEQKLRQGAGLRILTGTVTSPTLAAQMRDLLGQFPKAKWHQYEAASSDAPRAGARLAFGEPVDCVYRFENARVILSLDADFLGSGPGALRYARAFADGRRVREEQRQMNRLYAAESAPALTGAMADHRFGMRAAEVETFARAVAAAVGVANSASAPVTWAKQVSAVAADLKANRGASLVVAGDAQPPIVHALAHAMNQALGNVGRTVTYTAPVEANPVDLGASLKELVADMKSGGVQILIMLGGNPVYDAPADLGFLAALEKVKLRVHLSLYDDETSEYSHWHVPEAHYLESWSDARAWDGTVSILQPLIAPLYDGRSGHEIVSLLAGRAEQAPYNIVRDYWKSQAKAANFEEWWRTALHDGLIAGSASAAKTVALKAGFDAGAQAAAGGGMELLIRPDPTVWDGSFANNGWLQELPKPLTKITWDNAAYIGPKTAEGLKLANEDLVELHYRGRVVRAPIWIQPGQPENAVTVHLGYGRTRGGKAASGAGFNAYALRTSDAPWGGAGLEIRKLGGRYGLACTQHHHSMEGRDIIRVAEIAEFRKDPHGTHHGGHANTRELSLYPDIKNDGYAWGMAIDQNACIGCNACVVACQAENNIPVVGKREVTRGREMHWIRIDRYYRGEIDVPETYYQPMLCQHCENAPCEVVCPVAATVHSEEGLNQMVYNRCIGTRYCSNNCPYKVRRFNFFLYADYTTPSLELLRNPDVTVRSRGVMEKCTYCVQRIQGAKIESEKQDRTVRDGEIVTACEAACPTRAIVFGNINDRESRVSKLRREPLHYGVLEELQTRPRTTYLSRVRNPNPDLEKG